MDTSCRNRLNDLSLLYVENINKQGKIKITNGSQNNWGLDWSKSEHTDGTALYFKKAGTVRFYFYIKWEDKEGTIRYQWFAANIQALSNSTAREITVYDKVLQNISVSGQTTSFYKHSTFSLGSGIVKATYKYPVDGSLVEVAVMNNYRTTPSIGSELVTQGQSTAIVEFGSCSASYSYNVYGVDEDVTFPSLPQVPRYLPAGVDFDLIKEQYLYGTITYEDGTTSNNERSDMSFSIPSSYVGKMPVKYSIRIPKLCKWKTVNGFPEVVIDRRIEYGDGDDGQPMSPHYTEKSI